MSSAALAALGIALLGLAGSALFAGFEIGMVSIRTARLDHAVAKGFTAARLIKWFLNRPTTMLATTLLGTNLCQSFAAVFFDRFALGLVVSANAAATTSVSAGAAVVLTLVLLVFSEITPKMWFRQHPFRRCRLAVYPVAALFALTYPLIRAIAWLVSGIERLFPGRQGPDIPVLREDFRHMIRESEKDGLLSPECRLLLDNSLQYDRHTVRDLFRPRAQVKALAADTTVADALQQARDLGLSRFPVHLPGQPQQWVGVFSTYDAIFRIDPERWAATTVREHIRPLTVVGEKATPSQVLRLSHAAQSPLLVVVAPNGNQVGIVTANDAVRPLFGNLAPAARPAAG